MAFRVTAEKGEEIAVRRWTVEMTGRSIGDLLDLLPESGECFVNADLVLATSWQHKPITGEFSRASASGSNLTLRSARGEDLRAIRNVVVASGVALVRAEFEHGKAEGMAEVDHFTKHAREVLLEDLPDMQSCLVNVGDEVREGQALVRNAHKEKVLSERSKLGDARAQLLLAAETMQKNEETAAARLKVQRSAIEDAKSEVEKVRWLVEQGAKTQREHAESKRALAALEEQESETLRALHEQRLEFKKLKINLDAAERGALERCKPWLRKNGRGAYRWGK
ncbi:hypothetical protein [Rubritalea tangerina]|uniref:hypothetical protein n=1 Tax=Rubritalea tangerina TaxID=430798 RepID=UPI003619CD39